MRTYHSQTPGKRIPASVMMRTERRILDYAAKHCPGKFTRIDVRFRGPFCYIDVYPEPDTAAAGVPPPGQTRAEWIESPRNTPTHLCRIRYTGSADRWAFAWYSYAHEKYQPSFLITGSSHGTPEEAFETSTLFS
jgi:hypothetical protein